MRCQRGASRGRGDANRELHLLPQLRRRRVLLWLLRRRRDVANHPVEQRTFSSIIVEVMTLSLSLSMLMGEAIYDRLRRERR